MSLLVLHQAARAYARIRERLAQDRMPLLSLLERDPLKLQFSHLSLQEYAAYFAACAICGLTSRRKEFPALLKEPWRLEQWWGNVVRLGAGCGRSFGQGLLTASGLTHAAALDLTGKIRSQAALAAVAEMVKVSTALTSLSLAKEVVVGQKAEDPAVPIGEEGGRTIGAALKLNRSLTSLVLGSNAIGPAGARAIAEALKVPELPLTTLLLANNKLGPEGGRAVAQALELNTTLTSLDLGTNQLGQEGGVALAESLGKMSLTILVLQNNEIGTAGAAALARGLGKNRSLISLDFRHNRYESEKMGLLKDAIQGREPFRLQV